MSVVHESLISSLWNCVRDMHIYHKIQTKIFSIIYVRPVNLSETWTLGFRLVLYTTQSSIFYKSRPASTSLRRNATF
jgi:hypothetical protein